MSDFVLMLITGSEIYRFMPVLCTMEGLTVDLGCWPDVYTTSDSVIETD